MIKTKIHAERNKLNCQLRKMYAYLLTCIPSRSISESTHPTDPSPLHTRIRKGSKWRKSLNLSRKHSSYTWCTHICCRLWSVWKDRIFDESFLDDVDAKLTYPGPGPPFIRSNTCAGFNNCLNLLRNLIPWLSPDLLFTNTKSGLHPVGLTASQASSLPDDII